VITRVWMWVMNCLKKGSEGKWGECEVKWRFLWCKCSIYL
jgi:hypothetical protein